MVDTTTLTGVLNASGASSPSDLAGSTPASYNKSDLESAQAKLKLGFKYYDPSNPNNALTDQERNAIDAKYTFATALIVSDPALMSLFTDAVKNNWDANRFELEAEKTDWFKNKTASQEWYAVISSRGTAAKDLEEIRSQIFETVKADAVQRLGLDTSNADTLSKLNEITDYVLKNEYKNVAGWSTRVPSLVTAAFKNLKATELGGSISKTITDLSSTYRALGLRLSDADATSFAQKILMGDTTADTLTAAARKNAAQMWTQFSDRITAGESLQGILYPYTQLIGSMLEVDPESLDFTVEDPTKSASSQIDPLLQSALFSSADQKGVMSLTDLRKSIKKDKRWQYTKNAKDEYATLTTELMRMFGAGV